MRKSFYGSLYAQGYDIGTDASAIISFYMDQWKQLGKPNPVLEVMCGTGINLIPFLEAGATGDGLDESPHMLAIFREKLTTLGLVSNLYEQPLETMNLPQQYGFILIPDRSFGHIHDKIVAIECLKRLREALLPNGRLIFDVRPPEFISVFGQHGSVDHELTDYPDGSTVFTTGYWQHLDEDKVIRKWNKMERFVNNQLIETEVFDYYERFYDLSEMKDMLVTDGFNDIQICKAYESNLQPTGQDGIVFSCGRN